MNEQQRYADSFGFACGELNAALDAAETLFQTNIEVKVPLSDGFLAFKRHQKAESSKASWALVWMSADEIRVRPLTHVSLARRIEAAKAVPKLYDAYLAAEGVRLAELRSVTRDLAAWFTHVTKTTVRGEGGSDV